MVYSLFFYVYKDLNINLYDNINMVYYLLDYSVLMDIGVVVVLVFFLLILSLDKV